MDTLVMFFGVGMLVLLILFVLVSAVSSITKRFFKNISNLIAVVLAVALMVLIMPAILEKSMDFKYVQSIIQSLTEDLEVLTGSSIIMAESLAKVVVSAIITPVVFIICLIITKILMLIITSIIPPLKRLCSRKVDGKNVQSKPVLRVVGFVLAVFVGASCYFVMFAPLLSVANVGIEVAKSIPDEFDSLYSDKQQEKSSGGNTTFNAIFEATGTQIDIQDELWDSVVPTLLTSKNIAKKLDGQIIFNIYNALGLDNISVLYLDNSAKSDYTFDGKNYQTKPMTEMQDTLDSLITIGSYYLLKYEDVNVDSIITNEMFENAIYKFISNNALLDILDLISNATFEDIGSSFGVDKTQLGLDEAINLGVICNMTKTQKQAEGKALAVVIKNIITNIDALTKNNIDPLKILDILGDLFDDMTHTKSLGNLPENLMIIFTNTNETIQKYLSSDIIDELVTSVKLGDSTYREYFMNVKAGLDLATSFNTEKEERDEEFTGNLEEDFGIIYDNTNESVVKVLKQIIEKVVDDTADGRQYKELKENIINVYFDEMYKLSKEINEQAEDETDELKQKELRKGFTDEAKAFGDIIELVGVVTNGNKKLTTDIIEAFTQSVTESKILQTSLEAVRDDATAKAQFIELYLTLKEESRGLFESDLELRFEGASNDVKDSLNLIIDILDITFED